MRITTTQLREMIDAEVKSALNRVSPSKLVEARITRGGDLYAVGAEELIAFARAYSSLGDAVTEQLETIIEYGPDADPDDINPAAIKEVVRTIGGVNEEIDTIIAEWQAKNGMTGTGRRR